MQSEKVLTLSQQHRKLSSMTPSCATRVIQGPHEKSLLLYVWLPFIPTSVPEPSLRGRAVFSLPSHTHIHFGHININLKGSPQFLVNIGGLNLSSGLYGVTQWYYPLQDKLVSEYHVIYSNYKQILLVFFKVALPLILFNKCINTVLIYVMPNCLMYWLLDFKSIVLW